MSFLSGLLATLLHPRERRTTLSQIILRDQPLFGQETRKLFRVFENHRNEHNCLSPSNLRPALQECYLFPSRSQVHEMLQHAGSGTAEQRTRYHVTFGEFCVLATELSQQYKRRPKLPVPKSLVKERRLINEARRKKGTLTHFQVFLGGSCNPTTWRMDTAIPYLKQKGITFYNPQVSHWKPELIELEDQAKQGADVLFFVIDSQTRATVSRIEVAYLVGAGRKIVVVLKEYDTKNGNHVGREKLSNSELRELDQGQCVLTDLIERQSLPVFHSVFEALKSVPSFLQPGTNVQELTAGHCSRHIKYGHLKVGHDLMNLRNAFQSIDSSNTGVLNIQDICLAYRCCMPDRLDPKWLAQIKGSDNATFTFDEFCCLLAERRKSSTPFWSNLLNSLVNTTRWFLGIDKNGNLTDPHDHVEVRDIFLGGTVSRSNWRNSLAIPILRKHGLTYASSSAILEANPLNLEVNWLSPVAPTEVSLRDSCRVLLFVIPNDSRACTAMAEASYHIGQGCYMVLCLQYLHDNVAVDGEKLSSLAVQDYNRGRMYLSDLANREGVPTFDNIEESIQAVVMRAVELRNEQMNT